MLRNYGMINSCLALYGMLEEVRIEWGRLGRSSLKPMKVTFSTTIIYNSENNIRDIRSFFRPIFCHSSVVKYASTLLQNKPVMRLDCQIVLKSPPLRLLAVSAPGLELIIADTSLTFHGLWDCPLWVQYCDSLHTDPSTAFCTHMEVISQ